MSGTTSTIIPPDTLAKINSGLEQLDIAQKELDLAKRAGIHELQGGESLQGAQQQIDATRKHLLSIKNVYFPNA